MNCQTFSQNPCMQEKSPYHLMVSVTMCFDWVFWFVLYVLNKF